MSQGTNSNSKVDEMVENFINQLVIETETGKNVDEEVLAQLKTDLQERLENRINAVILSNIPEYKLEEFEKLIDSGDKNSIQSFCTENIPNLTELIAAELINFRSRYISS